MKINKKLRIVLIILFTICMGIMIYLVCAPSLPIHINVQSGNNPIFYIVGRATVDYIPLQEINDIGFWLNMIMTMLIGGLVLLLSDGKLNFEKIMLYGLLVGISIEFVQFVLDNLIINFQRFVDINGVISNMIGIVLEFYLLMLFLKLINFKN